MPALAASTRTLRPVQATLEPRLRLALGMMVVAQFLVMVDFSIVNVALPTIQHALRFSPAGAEGIITAYGTAFAGALILGGRLADRTGRRRVFLTGLVAFAGTSLACSVATAPAGLIVARAAQGLSAALLAPSALALLAETFDEGVPRNRALGVFGAATALGFLSGQVLGGVLTDLIGWRSIFLINVPVAIVAAVLSRRVIAADRRSRERQGLDLLGALLITSGMALLVWAPARGAQHGWGSAGFLGTVAAGVSLVSLFLLVEANLRHPLVRLSMLRSRWLGGTIAVTCITGSLTGAVILLITLYLQQTAGYSPLQAGFAFAPAGLAGFLAATRYAGPLITRRGVRAVLTGALVTSAIAIAALSRLPGGGYLTLLPFLTAIGVSFTTAAVATTVAVTSGARSHQHALVAALRQTAYQVGVALGVALLLSIAASNTSGILSAPHPPSRVQALASGIRLSLSILAALAALGACVARFALGGGQSPTAE
jgi:EmrB/QacA subfamily drug resistance transporter